MGLPSPGLLWLLAACFYMHLESMKGITNTGDYRRTSEGVLKGVPIITLELKAGELIVR